LLKLAKNAEQSELNEFVKLVSLNTSANHQLTKLTVPQNVGTLIQKQTKKCTNHKLQEKNTNVNNAENIVTYNYQNQEEVSVAPDAFINITEERITHYGKEELHQNASLYTVPMNGETPLKMFGKEIMQLVKDVNVETINSKDLNSTYTTLSVLNIKNSELMLAIFYLFAKNATIGYTPDTINQKNLSVQFKITNGYTNHVSNSQRYKMLGNGWTVDVIVHLLKPLA